MLKSVVMAYHFIGPDGPTDIRLPGFLKKFGYNVSNIVFNGFGSVSKDAKI